jgi:hypothetical protein
VRERDQAQVVSPTVASFRVVNFCISADQADFWSGFDFQQLN